MINSNHWCRFLTSSHKHDSLRDSNKTNGLFVCFFYKGDRKIQSNEKTNWPMPDKSNFVKTTFKAHCIFDKISLKLGSENKPQENHKCVLERKEGERRRETLTYVNVGVNNSNQ